MTTTVQDVIGNAIQEATRSGKHVRGAAMDAAEAFFDAEMEYHVGGKRKPKSVFEDEVKDIGDAKAATESHLSAAMVAREWARNVQSCEILGLPFPSPQILIEAAEKLKSAISTF